METELPIHEKGPNVNKNDDRHKATLKKISNLKTTGFDGIH